MVSINNFTTSPDSFSKGKAKRIDIHWKAFIAKGDNPVDITLTLEDDRPVFFIDSIGNTQAEVLLGTFEFTEEDQHYSGATFIIVKERPDNGSDFANIRMSALDKNGASVVADFAIIYK